MEAATAEREREIAALQADLGSVRTELEHWRSTAAKYEEEISRLQEAFTQQQQQEHTANQLQSEQCACACACACACVEFVSTTSMMEKYLHVGPCFI